MSSHDTLITGRLPRPQPGSLGLVLAAARGHARVPLGERHLELAHRERPRDGHLVLRAFVCPVRALPRSAGDPIMKLPAGTTTISGQSAHSLKLSFGFSARSSAAVSGAPPARA